MVIPNVPDPPFSDRPLPDAPLSRNVAVNRYSGVPFTVPVPVTAVIGPETTTSVMAVLTKFKPVRS